VKLFSPKDNEKDIPEIPEYIRNEMKVHVVEKHGSGVEDRFGAGL